MTSHNRTIRAIRCHVGTDSFFLETSHLDRILRPENLEWHGDPGALLGSMRTETGDIPAIRLASLLGLRVNESIHDRVMLLRTPAGHIGLVVNYVSQVQELEPTQILPLPGLIGSNPQRLFTGAVRFSDALSLLLNESFIIRLAQGQGGAQERAVPASSAFKSPAGERVHSKSAAFLLSQDHGQSLILCELDADLAQGGSRLSVGLSSRQVVEVLMMPPVTSVPLADPHVDGITCWRNVVLPVLDLQGRLGLSALAAGDGRLVIIAGRAGDGPVAMRVSSNIRMLRLPVAHQAYTGPVFQECPGILGVVKLEQELLLIPRISHLLQTEESFSASGHSAIFSSVTQPMLAAR